ncbi:MAG: alpha/beta fold hydrolase [Gammaproteobacteria bacterium]|nr:MAG: alpha/beta fold hydrolase [Gammaproteobacteria bacterium]
MRDLRKGPTLVLLHDFGSSSQAWKSALPELAGRFHVVLIDLPGHGHSTGWLVPKFDYPGAAHAIFEVLDKLGVKDFEPIGPSTDRTLIVQGDHDRFFPLHVGVGLYAAIPKSYLWVVPDAGHLPCFDERHRDSFLKVALEFLGSDWESRH